MTDQDQEAISAPPPTEPVVEPPPEDVQAAVGRLCDVLRMSVATSDTQLVGFTLRDVREATTALRELLADVHELRTALEPFAETARRMGWHLYHPDDRALGEHVVEAPAADIGPQVAYCLMVGAFWHAAHLLDGDVSSIVPPSSTWGTRKRWWQR